MSTQSSSPGQIISLPKGGGALSGIGEKFSPDLHTGTGNFTVPVNLPSGRNGFQPEINLVYSTGQGNGPFGLGWSLNIPGVSRKTSAGVPLFNDNFPDNNSDVFILSGAEDLVPVALWRYDPNDQDRIIPVVNPVAQDWSNAPVVQFRPRTEGLFARILYYRKDTNIRWTVESKDGLKSIYGSSSQDPGHGIIQKPGNQSQIFAWKLTETRDPFGNKIRYEYEKDPAGSGNQLYLKSIKYVDYGDRPEKFLVHADFEYENRPDHFSEYRSGFEIRTTRRCKAIRVTTKTDDRNSHPVREYRFSYLADPYNGVSLLQQLDITGFDDDGNAYSDDADGRFPRQLPPLTFSYTSFAPETRRLKVVEGHDLPALTPDMELVDLHGSGLPDILEMNGTVRFWRNLGNGRFDMPRSVQYAPYHALSDPGVQMIDANGDGRIDLLVTSGPLAGYYPMEHGGKWSEKSFQRYTHSPGFNLDDPEVKLVDINGDGYTDIVRSGSRMECFFNDPDPSLAWKRTNFANRQSMEFFPNVNFSDPRVRFADMTGDGLQDIVLIHDGNVEYWPNLGHNRWGKRVRMQNAPRYNDPWHTAGYDPKRLLLGDVVGDGLADMIYVDHDRVKLWINQSGNGWSKDPVIILGTPPTTGMDHVRLIDLYGTGVSGVLWSRDGLGLHRRTMIFLDFTGGVKPCVMNGMDNHMGAVTRVEYKPSTWYFLKDQQNPATRWRTPLPFPVQVVSRVEVVDKISKGKKSAEYKYHHGYWDGAEREFRGFGMVEQLDTESFDIYHTPGLHGDTGSFIPVAEEQFSSPKLTRSWFHQGPVGEEYGDWQEVDYSSGYWQGDPHLLGHSAGIDKFLGRFNDRGASAMPSPANRRVKRDALRTLRGSLLRTELYGLDGSKYQYRPYTVTEHAWDLVEITATSSPAGQKHIFFPHQVAARTTEWERGEDPMTQFAFTDYLDVGDIFDPFGRPHRQSAIAMPRLKRNQETITGAVVGTINPNETKILASHSHTTYASPPADGPYIHDRVAQVVTMEPSVPPVATDTAGATIHESHVSHVDDARRIAQSFKDAAFASVIGHNINYYDGAAFTGMPVGQTGKYGALMHSRNLVMTGELLNKAYGNRRPDYLDGAATLPASSPAISLAKPGYHKDPLGADPGKPFYYMVTLSQRLSGRGLPLAIRDPLGNETNIEYDQCHLLPVKVTDAGNMQVTTEYNKRLLLPGSITGPNGDTTHVRYSPAGLPEKQFVTGRDAQDNQLGGTEDKPDLSFLYDFLHFINKGEPVYVHTTRRINHARDSQGDDTIESREYSDGFGRLIQTRRQGEEMVYEEPGAYNVTTPPVSLPGHSTVHLVADSVVVGGWEVFDNKGKPVKKYEPFFSTNWDFQSESEARKGRHSTFFYDPRGQMVRTINHDGSQHRVISGRPIRYDKPELTQRGLESAEVPENFIPTPWESYLYDPNDLAPLTHPVNHGVPDNHHFTPASMVMDGLGRTRTYIVRNGQNTSASWYITRSSYDIRGNLLMVLDELGREAFRYHYDLLDRLLAVNSLDAGLRTYVTDAGGNMIEYRDSKGIVAVRTYDKLNRLVQVWSSDVHSGPFTLREKIEYGDEGSHDQARLHNTLGKPVRHFDEAGQLEMTDYDFKGNLLQKFRKTIKDNLLESGWLADWSAGGAEAALEDKAYQTSSSYDALNRLIKITYPEDAVGERKVLTPGYNRAGALETIRLGNDSYIQRIIYNPKGLRAVTVYGNGIMTRQLYDQKTFRLAHLRTERFSHSTDPNANTETWSGNGQVLQDFKYHYDLTGNITSIDENVPNCGIAGSGFERDRLSREFTYDPLYRLLTSTGRAGKEAGGFNPLTDDQSHGFFSGGSPNASQSNAPDLTEHYKESFTYDPSGNMLKIHYKARNKQWSRYFGMAGFTHRQWMDKLDQAPGSVTVDWGSHGNRHTCVGDIDQAANNKFDDNGNLIRQNTGKYHTWDHADRMIGFEVRADESSPPSVRARYLYGADGFRVKKWVRRGNGNNDSSVVYIDGIFEHQRWQKDGGGENSLLHINDDQLRVALVRVGPHHPDDRGVKVQYHLDDHLGSSHIVVGGDDMTSHGFVNREEYFAYGETSFGSFGRKRYRYSGKERDEESGLSYFGARYMAPWLARWISCDPLGQADGTNLYSFVRSRPVNMKDKTGLYGENISKTPQASSAGNPGERIGEVEMEGTIYAHYRAKSGTWVSASAKQEGTGYSKESAYGAYNDIVLDRDLNPLLNPDLIEPGQEYLIPIGSASSPLNTDLIPDDPVTKIPDNKGFQIDSSCEAFVCEGIFGVDKEGVRVGLEGKAGFGENFKGFRGGARMVEIEGEYLQMENFTANAELSLEHEGNSTRFGIGGGATVIGGRAKKIPLPFGEDTRMDIGISFGLSLGYRGEVERLPDGRARSKSSADFGPFHLGLSGTSEPGFLLKRMWKEDN